MVENVKIAIDGSLFISANCELVGTTWNRIDITKTAEVLMLDINGKLKRFRASAGENPITSWDLLNGVIVSDTGGNLPDITQITTRNHNDLQNRNAEGHTIGAFPSSELNQPSKLLQLNSTLAEVKRAQIPNYFTKLADIPQFQTWMKNRIGHLSDTTITGAAGNIEDKCVALTFDGNNIWVGIMNTPTKIMKLNTISNTYTVLEIDEYEDCRALIFDGTYIWASSGDGQGYFRILKINPVDNSYIAVIELPDVIYTTSNSDDIIQIFGDVSVVPSAGSLDAVEASIIAQKIS